MTEMNPLICIDFGNSYTKVAVRKEPDLDQRPGVFGYETVRQRTHADAIRDESLQYDELSKAVIPTAVAFTEHGNSPRYFCGTQVDAMPSDVKSHPSTKVHRNWKPHFFDATPTLIPDAHAIRANDDLGAEYRTWRQCYRAARRPPQFLLTFEKWAAVRESFVSLSADAAQADPESQFWNWDDRYNQLNGDPRFVLGFDEWSAVRDVFAASAAAIPVATPHRGVADDNPLIDTIASKFFSWLHKFVQDSLRDDEIDVSATPVRITLPAFGNIQGATQRLRTALAHAGWACDQHVPVLSEPVANAMGFFTRGYSVLRKDFRGIWDADYREMLGRTNLMRSMRHGRDYHWVLTIDIGGYTTDFSMTGFHTHPDSDDLFPDVSEQGHRLSWDSKVGGVQDLDRQFAEQLPDNKKSLFMNMLNDPDQKRLERFHRNVFGELRGFQLPVPGLYIAADNEERDLAVDILGQLAKHVCNWADEFASRYERIDEVILTGGGFSIPVIRDTVARHLMRWGPQSIVAPLHEPLGEDDVIEGCSAAEVDFAPALLNRCSTAFGGTSILFG